MRSMIAIRVYQKSNVLCNPENMNDKQIQKNRLLDEN